MINVEYILPSATLLAGISGVSALQLIEGIGRVSHRSEDAMTAESYRRFIPAVVLQHGDWSIVEHISASVEFLVDRGISHEIVRHRIASYTQESTRFVNYAKKQVLPFIRPLGIQVESHNEKIFKHDIKESVNAYEALLAGGATPQIARSVLPNALATKLIMTCNLRNWRNFLIKRTTKETHPEMRRVTDPLLVSFKAEYPYIFDDIVAGERQVDALRRGM